MEFIIFMLLFVLEFAYILLLNEMFEKFEDKTKKELELQKSTLDDAIKNAKLKYEEYKKELLNCEAQIRALDYQIKCSYKEIENLKSNIAQKHLIIKELSIPRAKNKRKI